MNKDFEFRQAQAADAPRIMEIIRQAQAQMRALGSRQWQDGYPALCNIERDIALGYGYVFDKADDRDNGNTRTVIAYGAVVFDGEPAYNSIDGAWLTGGEYVVLHRLAVANEEKGRGLATQFMLRVEELARERGIGSFRVDTNFDNRYMLRIFEKLGFVYCGKIVYDSGERLAFEKPFRK
ncbi:GNAT family N-acetyltransferase [uncultured Alistipes sp.]|nr:GNAT family N-acetyltransferase [uncultured Alistipes sp.]